MTRYAELTVILAIGLLCGYLFGQNQTYRHIVGGLQDVTKLSVAEVK